MISIRNSCYDGAWAAVEGFAGGWLAGTALIAGGKLWTVMTDPAVKVSALMGHIGQPSFRRELAVGIAVFYLAHSVLYDISKELPLLKDNLGNNLKGRVFSIIRATMSLALGALAASAVTAENYRPFALYPVCLLAVGLAITELYHYRQQRQNARKENW